MQSDKRPEVSLQAVGASPDICLLLQRQPATGFSPLNELMPSIGSKSTTQRCDEPEE